VQHAVERRGESGLERSVSSESTPTEVIDISYFTQLKALSEWRAKAGKAKTIGDLERCYQDTISDVFEVQDVTVKIFKTPEEANSYTSSGRKHLLKISGEVNSQSYDVAVIEFSDTESAMGFIESPSYEGFNSDMRTNISKSLTAWVDERTGLFTQNYEKGFMEKRRSPTETEKEDYGVIMIDIDNFRHYNSAYGHETGDQVLKLVGEVISGCIRNEDIDLPVRRGEGADEILIYAMGCSEEGVKSICERVQESVKRCSVGQEHVTVSIGYAHSSEIKLIGSRTKLNWMANKADKRMYKSKGQGGDHITGPEPDAIFGKPKGANYLSSGLTAATADVVAKMRL
jgi:diguanylate cyclase (GGDEF)-like protein